MKSVLIALFLIPLVSFGIKLQARFDHAVFYGPEVGHYVETYLNITGHSVKYIDEGNGLSAKLEITQIIKKGEDIIAFEKYVLNSQPLVDSLAIDIKDQKRFGLEAGNYTFEISMLDLNKAEAEPVKFEKKFTVREMDKGLHISDIELLESIKPSEVKSNITKAGYDLIPYVDNFYPEEMEKLAFYGEIYNSNKTLGEDAKFYVAYQIEDAENFTPVVGLSSVDKMNTAAVVPLVKFIDIKDLSTGKYRLAIKIVNRSNEEVSIQYVYFSRLNMINNTDITEFREVDIKSTFVNLFTSEDTLDMHIASLRPLTSPLERRIMDNDMENFDFDTKKQFFYKFWSSRNETDPEDEWNLYKNELRIVEKMFGTRTMRGFETDRGRIYLKYGAPDQVENRPSEPSSYPYTVWQYYRIAQFTNRFFVFYNPDLATDNYVLLHSDMQGEVANYNWQAMLTNRNTPFNDIDQTSGRDHYGSQAGAAVNRAR